MTGMSTTPAFLFWDVVSQNRAWPGIMIFLISASQIARITGVSHWHLVDKFFIDT
jgi:hypothetical protein